MLSYTDIEQSKGVQCWPEKVMHYMLLHDKTLGECVSNWTSCFPCFMWCPPDVTYLCACVCDISVCVHIGVDALACICMCEGQMCMSKVFLYYSLSVFFPLWGWFPWLDMKLMISAKLTDQKVPEIDLSLCPQHWDYIQTLLHLALLSILGIQT